ncbi:hypothetical protein QUF58_05950 [Anaerolineales bacterium HSG24]|nr:hypothetical protein [Anaerolineales bacterium HSG24]
MIIISDTNILSSFAACDSLPLLFRLFSRSEICIPPAVQDELQVGLKYGKTHLNIALKEIFENRIQRLPLSSNEQEFSQNLPKNLKIGEREGIALAQNRKLLFLSNDKQAVRYCHRYGILANDLVDILRLLWTRRIISKHEVKVIINKMTEVEELTLSSKQLAIIFASSRRRR